MLYAKWLGLRQPGLLYFHIPNNEHNLCQGFLSPTEFAIMLPKDAPF